MLKIKKSARAIAMLLVVLTIAVSSLLVFADTGVASAAKDPLISEEFVITQEQVNVINLKGKLDVSFINDAAFGVTGIVVRIGADELGSQVKKLPYDAEGNVDYDVTVNAALALEYGNVIPVVISYSYISNGEVALAEIPAYFGVITYDYETGVLGAPAGTEYLVNDPETGVDSWKALEAPYAPTDAKGFADETPNVTLAYQNAIVNFAVNTTVVEDAPEIVVGAPFLKDMTANSVTIVTDPTLEYIILDATKGIDESYELKLFDNAAWFTPDGAETLIKDLKPEGIYTVWARTPAGDDTLASAPVCLGRIILLTEAEYEALNAFLVKYHEVTVIKGNNLYTPETPVVTADPKDTKALLTLYNILDPTSKKLITVVEKAEYLVISDYLANYQDLVYDDLDDLREKYTADELDEKLNAAFDAFGKLVLNAEQQEMFADFDDTILEKKIAFALIKVEALSENGKVDVESILTKYEELETYNELLETIKNATDCETVDAAYEEAFFLVHTAKYRYLWDIVVDKFEIYAPTLEIYAPDAYDQLLELTYVALEAIFYEFDNNAVDPYTSIVDDVNAFANDIVRYCAFAELYSIVVMPEADTEKADEFCGAAYDIISSTYDEFEIGKAVSDYRIKVYALNVAAGIKLDDDADEINRAIARVLDEIYAEFDKLADVEALKSFLQEDINELLIYIRDNYQYFNFIYDNAEVIALDVDTVTFADVEDILAVIDALYYVDVEDYDLYYELDDIYYNLCDCVIVAYVNEFLSVTEKDVEDEDREALIEDMVTLISDAYYEYVAYTYEYAVVNVEIYDKVVATVAELEALKVNGNAVLNAAVDKYIQRVVNVEYELIEGAPNLNAVKNDVAAYCDRELAIAKLELAFQAKKAETKAEIEAMKDANAAVIAIVDKYLADLHKVVFKYEKVEDIAVYETAAMNSINNIKNAAKIATDFEKARIEAIAAVSTDHALKKASGKYSEDQIKQLDSKLSAAIVALNNLYVENGNDVAEIEATKAAALADLASVEVSILVSGTPDEAYPDGYKFESGLWGTVTNYNGMNSALNVVIGYVDADDKELADKFDVEAVMTNEQANVAAKDKAIIFAFNISFSDAALLKDDNGFYTVKMLAPADVKDTSGICVMAEGEGVNYVFETTLEGDYIVFKTNKIGATHFIVVDKNVNLTWLVVVLAVLIAIEAVIVIFFAVKMKKGTKAAAFAPFLAVLFTPAGVVPATIALGVVSAAGAVAATATVVKAKKKNSTSAEQVEAKSEEAPASASENSEAEAKAEAPEVVVVPVVVEDEKEEEKEEQPEEVAEEEAPADEKPEAPEVVVAPVVVEDEKEEEKEEEQPEEEAEEEAPAEEKPEAPEVVVAPVVVEDEKEEEKEEEQPEEEAEEEAPADEKPEAPEVVVVPVVVEDEKEEEAQPEIVDVETDDEAVEESEPEEVAPVIVPLVVAETSDEEEEQEEEEEIEPTVSIATADVEDNDAVVVPIVITDDVEEEAVEEEAPITDDDAEDAGEDTKVFSISAGNRVYVTYDYSFQSKLAQSSEDVQSRYAIISDTLLSYGLKLRESWKKERYFAKNTTYANMIFRGKTLCVCLAIKPESLEGTKYFYENIGNVKKYESVPVLVKIRSGRGCKYALELIKMMLEGAGFVQKRPVSDHFTVAPALTKEELIEKGYIKVMMTDGEGHPVPADFEAMRNNKFFSQNAGMPILKKVSAEEAAAIPDDEVKNFIETEEEKEIAIAGRKKGIINIDTISENYADGDVVTLQNLISKKLVAKNVGFIKVLARGTLDKSLTVKAHDFSMDAAKMIVIANGNVVKLKAKR